MTWSAVDFRAMGSRCRIVAPDHDLAAAGRALVERLERSWTRFCADSELSTINAAAGQLCMISPELHAVLAVAQRAHRSSGGRFDARCLAAVEHAGYDRSWWAPGTTGVAERHDTPPAPLDADPDAIVLLDDPPAVLVPSGQRLDLGGIGKGFAADLVVDHLRDLGASRVQVEMGGDIRVAGTPWDGGSWVVEVEDPLDPDSVAVHLELEEGAVATSSVLRRRWRCGARVTHHLVDTRTMRPAESDLLAVTTIAHEAWAAEVAAKCALVAGRDRAAEAIEPFFARALLFGADGTIEEVAT